MNTSERMRSLADAVDGSKGVRFQPTFPKTLRQWAVEIERLQAIIRINGLRAGASHAEIDALITRQEG